MSVSHKHAYRFIYLKSEEWQTVRAAVLASCQAGCFICGIQSVGNDVHHIEYPKNMWDTTPAHCVVLCRRCHKIVHRLIDKGLTVNKRERLTVLKDYVDYLRSKRSTEQKAKKQALIKGNHCTACHRSNRAVQHRTFHGDNMFTLVLCDECFALAPRGAGVKWMHMRSFFTLRRNQAIDEENQILKIEFDKSAREVDNADRSENSGGSA